MDNFYILSTYASIFNCVLLYPLYPGYGLDYGKDINKFPWKYNTNDWFNIMLNNLNYETKKIHIIDVEGLKINKLIKNDNLKNLSIASISMTGVLTRDVKKSKHPLATIYSTLNETILNLPIENFYNFLFEPNPELPLIGAQNLMAGTLTNGSYLTPNILTNELKEIILESKDKTKTFAIL